LNETANERERKLYRFFERQELTKFLQNLAKEKKRHYITELRYKTYSYYEEELRN